MLLPEPQWLRGVRNAGFSLLQMKCWPGPHDRRTIDRHRHTETDHFRHTAGKPKEREGNRVTEQLNDPGASMLPASADIKPRSQLKILMVAGWPLDCAEEFLIKKGHDLSGHYIIIQFPSWDSDRLMFVPTPL